MKGSVDFNSSCVPTSFKFYVNFKLQYNTKEKQETIWVVVLLAFQLMLLMFVL